MITMSDIARETGVSRATVSYVLNKRRNGVRISDETRRNILEKAAALGYRPNELARAMVTGKNRVLGFVTGGTDYEPGARILSGAIAEADKHNYFIKVFKLSRDNLGEEIVENSIKLRLAGLVVYSIHEYTNQTPTHDRMREVLQQHGISMSVVGANMYMYSDDEQGFRLTIHHLRELGHQKIGFLSGVPKARIAVAREQAWRAMMVEAKLPVSKSSILYGGWEIEPTQQVLADLQKRPAGKRPTALCCITDLAAFLALRAARYVGLRVPEDLSIVGFGGLVATGWSDPPLTTIAQPFEELGAAAVRRVLRMSETNDARETLPEDYLASELLTPSLVVRESTLSPMDG